MRRSVAVVRDANTGQVVRLGQRESPKRFPEADAFESMFFPIRKKSIANDQKTLYDDFL